MLDRDIHARFLNSIPSQLAVTLRYAGGPVSVEKIRLDLRALHGRIDRKLFGRDYHKSKVRSSYWAVCETLDGNPHVHCGWRFPSLTDAMTFSRMLKSEVWETIFAKGGTHDVQLYDATGYANGNGWAGYACKLLSTTDHLIFSESNIAIRIGDRIQ